MWTVLAAGLAIRLQQLSRRNVLPRAGSCCSGAANETQCWGWGGRVVVSVAGNCFQIITETWQAGALPVRVQVSARGAHTLPLRVFLPWPGTVWCGLGSGIIGIGMFVPCITGP